MFQLNTLAVRRSAKLHHIIVSLDAPYDFAFRFGVKTFQSFRCVICCGSDQIILSAFLSSSDYFPPLCHKYVTSFRFNIELLISEHRDRILFNKMCCAGKLARFGPLFKPCKPNHVTHFRKLFLPHPAFTYSFDLIS